MAKDIILKIIGDIGTDGANYHAMQFSGETTKKLIMDERLTLTNMTTEAGAKNGIIDADSITESYLQERTTWNPLSAFKGDVGASYADNFTYEIDHLEPTVAKPYSPGNISPARELQGTEIDKAYIGSCTGAKLHDLRAAGKVMKGKKVKVRTEVVPAAQSIYLNAMNEGLISIFLELGLSSVRQPAVLVVGPIWAFWPKTRFA